MGQCCGCGGSKKINFVAEYNYTMAELTQKTGMDLSLLRDYYTDFIKKYPSGDIKRKQFHGMYKKFFPDLMLTKRDTDRIFSKFDQDKNGTINFREFMIALSVQTQGTLIEKLTLAFQLYDVNGDGVLSYEEVRDIVKMMYYVAMEQGRMGELPNMETFSENLFEELDEDKNGQVTLDEFTNVGRQDPTMANLLLCTVEETEVWGTPRN